MNFGFLLKDNMQYFHSLEPMFWSRTGCIVVQLACFIIDV